MNRVSSPKSESPATGRAKGADNSKPNTVLRMGKDGASRPKPIMERRPRFRVDPLAMSPEAVARMLGVTLSEFKKKLPELERHGFPKPVPVLGTYYLPAIHAWLNKHNAGLFKDEPYAGLAVDARTIDFNARLDRMGAPPYGK